MRFSQTLRDFGALGLLLVASSCADSGYLESSYTIESICSADSRFAILVELDNPAGLPIDEVTATLEDEEQCFLERPGRRAAMYSCLEQGAGTYAVSVASGERTWNESVEVPADECHVTKLQKLTIALQ